MSDERNAAIHARAHAAGMAAAEASAPVQMRVVEHANPLNDNSAVIRDYGIIDVCGFAWVNVPGNSSFGRWAKRKNLGHKGHHGGLDIWVRDHGQSVGRKTAHAHAYAEVLREEGIRAYASSRED